MTISSYERLFGTRQLNGLVEVFSRDDARGRAASSLFEMGRPIMPVVADGSFEWDEVQFSRHLAPVVGKDSAAPAKTPLGKIVRSSAPAHVKTSVWIPASKLHGDRGPGSMLPNAQAVVDQEIRDGWSTIGNTKEYLSMGALFGSVVVNSTTIPGTEVPFSLSFGTNTYAAALDWSLSSTPILSNEALAAKIDYMQAMGLNPRRVLMGSTIAGYLHANSEVRNLLVAQYGIQLAQTAAELFSQAGFSGLELAGLGWQITEEGYVPEGGSFTRYIPATDKAVMLPADEDLRNVLGRCEGYALIPISQNDLITAGSQAAMAVGRAPQAGAYAYGIRHLNPLGVEIIMGWVGIYVILTPNGVMVLDVVP